MDGGEVDRDSGVDRDLLQELLSTYGPCGQEDAVREVCRRELGPLVDEMWTDAAGNLVGLIRGGDDTGDAPVVRVMAHMDELSMLVKRVERDGSLHVTQLGTMYPGNFGLGPVAVLGDRETLCGVLTLGSEHTTKESQRIWETKPDQGDKALDWLHVYVFTGRTPEQLAHAGVRPGTRVCIDRSKRTLVVSAACRRLRRAVSESLRCRPNGLSGSPHRLLVTDRIEPNYIARQRFPGVTNETRQTLRGSWRPVRRFAVALDR
jgi:putative aminopeptidase FrvX